MSTFQFSNRTPSIREAMLVEQMAEGNYAAMVELMTKRLVNPEQIREILDLPMTELQPIVTDLVVAFNQARTLLDIQAMIERERESDSADS